MRKILVVDDDHRLGVLLKQYLQDQGFAVKVVHDGKTMDKAMLQESFHCLVLDLMLPGEDGLKICHRLRNQDNKIPILMFTAKGDEMDRNTDLAIGVNDYLLKPFDPRDLVARINAILPSQ